MEPNYPKKGGIMKDEYMTPEQLMQWAKDNPDIYGDYLSVLEPMSEEEEKDAQCASTNDALLDLVKQEIFRLIITAAVYNVHERYGNPHGYPNDEISDAIGDEIYRLLVELAEQRDNDNDIIAPINHIPTQLKEAFLSTIKPETAGLWDILGAKRKQLYQTGELKVGQKKHKVYVTVELDYDGLSRNPDLAGVIQQLTPYDRKVFISVSSLYRAGNMLFTIGEISRGMGGAENPGPKDRAKIDQSIRKMAVTLIRFDNSREIQAAFNYPYIAPRWSPVLPISGVTMAVKGKKVEGYKMVEEPVLLTLALGRKQYTTIPPEILKSPNRQSDDVMLLEMVLRDQIAGMKHGCRAGYWREYRLDTFLKRCGFVDLERKRKQRLIKYTENYLKYLQTCEYINDWKWATAADGKTLKIRIQPRAPKKQNGTD